MGMVFAPAAGGHRGRSWLGARLLALALALSSGAAFAGPSTADLAGLTQRDGTPSTLEGERGAGNWLIVMVWATTCHVCVGEFPKFSQYHLDNAERGRQVLGIVLDGAGNESAVQAFYEKTGARFPSLVADFMPFASSYEAMAGESIVGTPTFLLFAPDGGLVGLHQGPLRIEALERFIARKSRTGV